MKKSLISLKVSAIAAILFLSFINISCSSDDNSNIETETPTTESDKKFFIAATQDGATYFLTADDLESGSTTIKGTGIEVVNSFTHLVSGTNNAITALAYRQGNPGIGISFKLDDSHNLTKLSNEFQLTSGYNTVGIFQNSIVAGRTATLSSGNQGAAFYFVDQTSGVVSSKEFESTQQLGNGTVTPTFAGIVDRGNGEWLSAYTKEAENVDSVWVASFDANFSLKRVYKDNRISYSTGRWRSARYSQMANDDKGNTYVFSGSYETSTTKPAGALRINKDAASFDNSYYFNIEEKSGGYRFRKVWHAGGDYFLLEFYNDVEYGNMTTATQYAIVNAANKTFQWIKTGFPSKENITETGWPIAYNGKVYFPVTTTNASPTVYVIDPTTATAKAGLVIEAGGVLGLGVFEY
ncbi:DUF4374 domain-containing protein [Chishuiella sp.]|uniref:DUF4374 domain-containing protein n=1 Tax=Chishuiella sp. TaxID=1969467 RepID=UPI0028AB4895|nr:DUF4374 domain-containing protein [Chishuiella sp.]